MGVASFLKMYIVVMMNVIALVTMAIVMKGFLNVVVSKVQYLVTSSPAAIGGIVDAPFTQAPAQG